MEISIEGIANGNWFWIVNDEPLDEITQNYEDFVDGELKLSDNWATYEEVLSSFCKDLAQSGHWYLLQECLKISVDLCELMDYYHYTMEEEGYSDDYREQLIDRNSYRFPVIRLKPES